MIGTATGLDFFGFYSGYFLLLGAQVNSPSHEEDLDDVGCNADLYASRQDAFQGSSRGSDERLQQQSDPHCFQSLSLD